MHSQSIATSKPTVSGAKRRRREVLFAIENAKCGKCVVGGGTQSALLKRIALVAGALTAIVLTAGLFPLSLTCWLILIASLCPHSFFELGFGVRRH